MRTKEEVYAFIKENDVKFIRLAFSDVFGRTKNIAILASQLDKALENRISIDASAIRGFGKVETSDLFLKPDMESLSLLPWRPATGRVARFYCNIVYPDGTPFELDGRGLLSKAVEELSAMGITAKISSEVEFYLFKMDEYGNSTRIPMDYASYMDIAPDDRGENVRREVCLTLEGMNIVPESSHHEEGPGQNEIDFHYSNPVQAADNSVSVKTVIKTISDNMGVHASFDPKPIPDQAGNGFHINISISSSDGKEYFDSFLAGIMKHIREITLFLNPSAKSYARLGSFKAPKYVSWSKENRCQLIRVPESFIPGEKTMELRSPDTRTNPYLAFALLIYAGMDGVKQNMPLREPVNENLFNATRKRLEGIEKLPESYEEAYDIARRSEFIKNYLPAKILEEYKEGVH